MVVRGGATMAAMGTSSKPITLMSCGTAMPCRERPAITPSAIWSLKAITAEALLSITRGTASTAASKVGAAASMMSTSRPDERLVLRTALRRSDAAHEPAGPPRKAMVW